MEINVVCPEFIVLMAESDRGKFPGFRASGSWRYFLWWLLVLRTSGRVCMRWRLWV